MSRSTIPAVSLKRRLLTLAAGTSAALAASLSMQAGTAVAHEANLVQRAYNYGDCSLTVGMQYWTHAPHAYAYGQATCNTRKARTRVVVTLKKNGGAEQTANTTVFTNSFGMGTRWLSTNWVYGCQFQAVMLVDIGQGPVYLTTGAPLNICGASSRSAKGDGAAPHSAPTRRSKMPRVRS